MRANVSEMLGKFNEAVGIRFQLYNSLFLSLPFYGVDRTGVLLSLFNQQCADSLESGKSPAEMIDDFFNVHDEVDKTDLMFRFVQYAERQVVLFDALEDAAFTQLNDIRGAGTLAQLKNTAIQTEKLEALKQRLSEFSVRLVLTAHPTQFYPGTVLGIINDLTAAIAADNVAEIDTLLRQLGRTPFFKKQKPTPFDEAVSLIWFLENVFYDAIGAIASEIRTLFTHEELELADLIRMGFWSGGDRDGNPFVTSDTTLDTAAALKRAVLRCYHNDLRLLKRRLTFANVEQAVAELERKLYANAYLSPEAELTRAELLDDLLAIRQALVERHDGLFAHLIDDLLNKVEVFGLHFATLDIRQEASEHTAVLLAVAETGVGLSNAYASFDDREKIEILLNITEAADTDALTDLLARDTLLTIKAVRRIQELNGTEGCERYIISQCRSALNVIEVYGLFLLGGWNPETLDIDIVPLFETITDLKHAAGIMRELYELEPYRQHLARRKNKQTIMLGFSDGTKDGGYLMANWSIYKAKDELTKISARYGVDVIFFDGRGGPPARGGGKTHKFYSSMEQRIVGDAIQLTVQGQTVSSNFGTVDAARFNIEQLLHAGIYNRLFDPRDHAFDGREKDLVQKLAEHSFAAYTQLKEDPLFLDYLAAISPLRFYSETNIGSRPAKRREGKLTLNDLRAIPFVGAWSQLKQNVPGFYGVGSAIKQMENRFDEIAAMYHSNGFFKALLDNAEMSMQKSNFALTAFLADDPEYGAIWQKIYGEFQLTRHYLNKLSGADEFMSGLPVEQQSVRTRERIVLPLVTIQQYALAKIREIGDDNTRSDERSVYEKLVIRCSFGIINAGRNSA
ncbi:MAG: phosphoenolpyruvate carboxylase [Acidobacteria bacterium]|nr:phosphoenolpyruvate carboxylase [Acidobacteriota bacterium]